MKQNSFDLKQINLENQQVSQDLSKQNDFSELGEFRTVSRNIQEMTKHVEQELISELITNRIKLMKKSQFSFFRGSAELMENDLEEQANSGILVLNCGDAHIENFGLYASPERNLLFDLNDFDEAGINPFEFDIKRLLVSIILAARENDFGEKKINKLLQEVTKTYRTGIKKMCKKTVLDRFYATHDIIKIVKMSNKKDGDKLLKRLLRKAKQRNSEQVVSKFTILNQKDQLSFKEDSPRTVHIKDEFTLNITKYIKSYSETLPADIKLLLSRYKITDVVRHSVGIGSYGSRCYLVLLTATDGSHLVLQVKEALPTRQTISTGEVSLTAKLEKSEGQRIVASQKILQSSSDKFIGYFSSSQRSYYVRQFRDMKESVKISKLNWKQFKAYTKSCAAILAMAHSQSPTSTLIFNYLSHSGKKFDLQISNFAWSYSEQVKKDYDNFVQLTTQE